MKKLLLLAIVVLGISAVSFGQATTASVTTAKASATILKALEVAKVTGAELNFGVVSSSASEGTVTIGLTNNQSVSGGVTGFSAFGASPKSAVFHIKGTSNNNYIIELPSEEVTLNGTGLASGQKMVIKPDTWVTTLGNYSDYKGGTLDDDGEVDIAVGATLTVAASQAPGNYDGTYTFTVTYE